MKGTTLSPLEEREEEEVVEILGMKSPLESSLFNSNAYKCTEKSDTWLNPHLSRYIGRSEFKADNPMFLFLLLFMLYRNLVLGTIGDIGKGDDNCNWFKFALEEQDWEAKDE